MNVLPWSVPALDHAAATLAAALIRAGGGGSPGQAAALFWQVRRELLDGPARSAWDDPATCEALGVPK